jgi:hypothetical protein
MRLAHAVHQTEASTNKFIGNEVWHAFFQKCKYLRLIHLQISSFCVSVLMEQLGSQRMDFHIIPAFLLYYVQKIQVWATFNCVTTALLIFMTKGTLLGNPLCATTECGHAKCVRKMFTVCLQHAVHMDVPVRVYSTILLLLLLLLLLFIFAAQRGLWPPRPRLFLITHNDAPQSVGLLWTSDQLVAETST